MGVMEEQKHKNKSSSFFLFNGTVLFPEIQEVPTLDKMLTGIGLVWCGPEGKKKRLTFFPFSSFTQVW